jgi:hypothetical protein
MIIFVTILLLRDIGKLWLRCVLEIQEKKRADCPHPTCTLFGAAAATNFEQIARLVTCLKRKNVLSCER